MHIYAVHQLKCVNTSTYTPTISFFQHASWEKNTKNCVTLKARPSDLWVIYTSFRSVADLKLFKKAHASSDRAFRVTRAWLSQTWCRTWSTWPCCSAPANLCQRSSPKNYRFLVTAVSVIMILGHQYGGKSSWRHFTLNIKIFFKLGGQAGHFGSFYRWVR